MLPYMTEPPILEQIRQKSNERISALRGNAESEASRIAAEASRQADDLVSKTVERVHAEAAHIRERQINSIRFAHNARRYGVKSRALDGIWREAANVAAAFESSDRYPAILAALFRECVAALPPGTIIKTAPSDVERVEMLVQESGLDASVVASETVHGGIECHWPSDYMVLINTLSHRLARLRSEESAALSHLLFMPDGETEP
jgi:vacuolar-type H+-ATPase subunit E/Vma4